LPLLTGMVRETGEATEKFLRSMAAGDAEAHRELHDAAAAALANLSVPCTTSEPACLAALASKLAQGAANLNQQVNGLLRLLQAQVHEPAGLAAIMASTGLQQVASGLGSRTSTSTSNQSLLVQPGLLPVASSSAPGVRAQAAAAGAAAATLQQLKAALAATAQLQQLATAAQQLLGAAEGPPAADAMQLAADRAADGDAAGEVRRSSQQEEFQEGFSGSKSPFAELLQQQMTGTLSGSSDAAAVAAAAAAASAATATGSSAASGGFVKLSTAAQDTAQSAPGNEDVLGMFGPSRSAASGLSFNNVTASTQGAATRSAAAGAVGSQFLRRLSLEVNPTSCHRRAVHHSGRASADLATPAAVPDASSQQQQSATVKPASGATDDASQ
jgi:hypothetical protein